MNRFVHIMLVIAMMATALLLPCSEGSSTVLCIEPDGVLNLERMAEDGTCSGCDSGEESDAAVAVQMLDSQLPSSCDTCLDIPLSLDCGIASKAVTAKKFEYRSAVPVASAWAVAATSSDPSIVPLESAYPRPLVHTLSLAQLSVLRR
ncbi:MAG: hypothetical protein AMXMBFR84_17150 [Candidatus Hydrogenedentota bacterium]